MWVHHRNANSKLEPGDPIIIVDTRLVIHRTISKNRGSTRTRHHCDRHSFDSTKTMTSCSILVELTMAFLKNTALFKYEFWMKSRVYCVHLLLPYVKRLSNEYYIDVFFFIIRSNQSIFPIYLWITSEVSHFPMHGMECPSGKRQFSSTHCEASSR